MAWEVTKLAIAYLLIGVCIVLVGNAIVGRVFKRVKGFFDNHLAPTRIKAQQVRVSASSLDVMLVRLECDLSDVVRKRCSEVAR